MNNVIGTLTWEACKTCKRKSEQQGCTVLSEDFKDRVILLNDVVVCGWYLEDTVD